MFPLNNLLLYFWLCWVFAAVWKLPLVVVTGLLIVGGVSCCRAWAPGAQASGGVPWGLGGCGMGVFLDQGLDLCPLYWQVDSYPLHHQGGPVMTYYRVIWEWVRDTITFYHWIRPCVSREQGYSFTHAGYMSFSGNLISIQYHCLTYTQYSNLISCLHLVLSCNLLFVLIQDPIQGHAFHLLLTSLSAF